MGSDLHAAHPRLLVLLPHCHLPRHGSGPTAARAVSEHVIQPGIERSETTFKLLWKRCVILYTVRYIHGDFRVLRNFR